MGYTDKCKKAPECCVVYNIKKKEECETQEPCCETQDSCKSCHPKCNYSCEPCKPVCCPKPKVKKVKKVYLNFKDDLKDILFPTTP